MLNAPLLKGSSPQLGTSTTLDRHHTTRISEDNRISNNRKLHKHMTPTPFKDLAGYMDKQVIACVEGTITKIQDKIARGTGQYGDWAMQFSTIKDAAGTFHDLVITDENSFLGAGMQGQKIMMESQPQSKGGPAGVSMGVRFKDGKENRSIKVDNRAKITLGGSGGYAPSQTPATQGRTVSVQSGGSFDQSPVRERVNCQMKVLLEVADQYKKLQADVGDRLPKLTSADLIGISISIARSYRGDLGSYAKPIFETAKVKQEPAKEPEDDLDMRSPQDDDTDIPF
jgi:hypothetical protein